MPTPAENQAILSLMEGVGLMVGLTDLCDSPQSLHTGIGHCFVSVSQQVLINIKS